MGEESVAHFEVTIMLIISFLIFPQELGDIFVGLEVLVLELFQPSFCMFDVELL